MQAQTGRAILMRAELARQGSAAQACTRLSQRVARVVAARGRSDRVGAGARLLAFANGIAPSLTQWAVRRWWHRVPFL